MRAKYAEEGDIYTRLSTRYILVYDLEYRLVWLLDVYSLGFRFKSLLVFSREIRLVLYLLQRRLVCICC